MMERRSFLAQSAALTAAGLTALPWPAARAQANWPQRPVRIISPYGAGGSNDFAARVIAEELTQRLGQPFLVENKPGAGTRIGNEFVARAAPDGATLLFAAAPYATVEALYGKLSYDPRRDLRPVCLAVVAPLFLIVNSDSPVKSVAELIALAKSRTAGLNVASPGSGSGPHLAGELLFREAGMPAVTVQYRGDATAYTELLAGRVDATLTAITFALPHIAAGKLRVLAVASEARSPIYPSAPTLTELGYPAVVGYGWFGFMVPSATPEAITAKLGQQVNEILANEAVRQKLAGQGLQVRGGSPADFQAFIDSEMRRWGKAIAELGIKGE